MPCIKTNSLIMIPPNQTETQADRHQMSNIKGVNFNTGGSRQRYLQDLDSEISEYLHILCYKIKSKELFEAIRNPSGSKLFFHLGNFSGGRQVSSPPPPQYLKPTLWICQ